MPISCVIITYNEEINIKRCLESISWCDDIHIIDSGSSDATVEIASKFNCKIIEKSFSNFADQRNFAIEKCELKYKWILHLDADEVVTSELRDFFLSRSYEKMAFKAYKIPFKLIFNGRWLKRAGMYPAYQVRFGYLDKLSYKMEGHGQKETLSTEETIILLCMGGIIYLFPLNDFRLKEDIRRMSEVYRVDLINGNRDFLFLMKESHKFDCNYLDFEYFIKSSGVEKIKDYKLSSDCYPIKEGRGPHYLILGDSHAGHLFEGLVQSIDPMLGFGLFSNSGCSLSSSIGGRQNRCTEGLKRTLETINSAPPHTVILAQRDEFLIDELEKVSRSLIEMGVARVVVLGPVPQYITTVPKIFIRGLMAGTEIAEIEKHVNEYLDPSIIKYDKFMQNKIKTGQYGFDYISVLNIFCSGGKYCKMDFTREEDIYPYLAIYDKNHLTPRAAVYLVDRIMKIL